MLITKDFVMLNFPKTGSSFARRIIKHAYLDKCSAFRKMLEKSRIYPRNIRDLMLLTPGTDLQPAYKKKNQHGTFRQIPFIHKNKIIVSITRNPISRYISEYHYGWWKKYPDKIILNKYPHFPNLSFSEYYEMVHNFHRNGRLQGITPKIELGFHTIQFIQFYFYDPRSVLRKINDNYIDNRLYLDDMCPIRFLHQENLNSDLKAFLIDIGFNEGKVKFIDTFKRVNITNKVREDEVNHLYELDSETQRMIIKREKLLFTIFPDYVPNL